MSRLRESVVQILLQALDKSDLGRANFEVSYPKTGQKLMKIQMRDFDQFRFEIGDTGGNPRSLFVHENPGAILKAEIHGGLSLDTVITRINQWADRLPGEIQASKINDKEVEKLIARLEVQIEENVADPHGQFEENEISELRARLDRLGERFSQLEEENKITKAELKTLKKQLEKSSKDLQLLPRGAWYRASISNIVLLLRKVVSTKEGRDFLASAAKKLIGLE